MVCQVQSLRDYKAEVVVVVKDWLRSSCAVVSTFDLCTLLTKLLTSLSQLLSTINCFLRKSMASMHQMSNCIHCAAWMSSVYVHVPYLHSQGFLSLICIYMPDSVYVPKYLLGAAYTGMPDSI